MTADGLATGLMVMGTEKGYQFAKQHGLSVLFLDVSMKAQSWNTRLASFWLDGDAARSPFAAILAVFLLALTSMAIVLFRPGDPQLPAFLLRLPIVRYLRTATLTRSVSECKAIPALADASS